MTPKSLFYLIIQTPEWNLDKKTKEYSVEIKYEPWKSLIENNYQNMSPWLLWHNSTYPWTNRFI